MHPMMADLEASLLREERMRLAAHHRRARAPSPVTAERHRRARRAARTVRWLARSVLASRGDTPRTSRHAPTSRGRAEVAGSPSVASGPAVTSSAVASDAVERDPCAIHC